MLGGEPTPAGSGPAAAGYSYPQDLARFVRDRWRDAPEPSGVVDPLPDAAALAGFFAACYQASMLREEERPVVFRALEGEEVAEEETGDVGARHRSAYRLCGALPGAVAVVVSQDGGVRFVC